MEITPGQAINFKNIDGGADTVKETRLRKACEDFEAILIKQLLTTMRKSVPTGGLFEGGFAKDIYQSIADEELAANMAHGGKGLGVSEVLFEKLSGQMGR